MTAEEAKQNQEFYNPFKQKASAEKRKKVSSAILQKHPERVPVVVQRAKDSDVPEINKNQFLVPRDCTVSKFQWEVRKQLKMAPEQAIFMYINNSLTHQALSMTHVYEKHKDDDGFLYVFYSGENTFGQQQA